MQFGKKLATLLKNVESKPALNEKYLKTKVKPFNGKINTNIYNNKIPTEGFQCVPISNIDWFNL